MSIQKKSLISTLKTAKKANVASSHDGEAKGSKISSMRVALPKPVTAVTAKRMRQLKATTTKSYKAPALKTIF